MSKGKCENCQMWSWVNMMTVKGESIGQYCADCFDVIDHDTPRRNRTISSSGKNHSDPGLENAIRVLEDFPSCD